MPGGETRTAVLAAIAGNLLIAATKFAAAAFSGSAAPICSAMRVIAVRSWLPFGRAGVPTQTNERSVERIASRTESVIVTVPPRITARVSSWMPVSTMGA